MVVHPVAGGPSAAWDGARWRKSVFENVPSRAILFHRPVRASGERWTGELRVEGGELSERVETSRADHIFWLSTLNSPLSTAIIYMRTFYHRPWPNIYTFVHIFAEIVVSRDGAGGCGSRGRRAASWSDRWAGKIGLVA